MFDNVLTNNKLPVFQHRAKPPFATNRIELKLANKLVHRLRFYFLVFSLFFHIRNFRAFVNPKNTTKEHLYWLCSLHYRWVLRLTSIEYFGV